MLFNSIKFLVFFPIVVLGYFVIPQKLKQLWLLFASYFFYMCWNVKYALLLFASTFVTYVGGLLIEKIKSAEFDIKKQIKLKKWVVAGSFIINLGILFCFKYINFAMDILTRVFARVHIELNAPVFDIILPVGISFYTFQALSYTMDVYRDEIYAEKNFFRYALFVSFFPQLVAGPIERSKNLLRQINENKKFDYYKARDGVYLMIWGYFIKIVVADRIAIFVDAVYADIDTFPGWYLIVANILFAFQIYCDFAGYSTIAMGSAKIMGFELTDNFNAPYVSASVSEFWRRWHISLSSWFKDYLYIPLGGNRKGRARKYANLMLVFIVSGLWHGASWTYVIWGGLNGLYQVIGDLKDNCIERIKRMNAGEWKNRKENIGVRILLTFVLVDFSWMFFRAESVGKSLEVLRSIKNINNMYILFDGTLSSSILSHKNFMLMIWGIVTIIASDLLKRNGICVREWIQKQGYITRLLAITISIVIIFVYGIYGSAYDATSFIYFQF